MLFLMFSTLALIRFPVCRFVCKNNGVLYESDLIQIGVKSEYRQNLGRITLFYGNKTSSTLQVNFFSDGCRESSLTLFYLQNFAANVTQAPENLGKINVQVKKPDDTIEAGAQVQQMINAECVDDYPGNMMLI